MMTRILAIFAALAVAGAGWAFATGAMPPTSSYAPPPMEAAAGPGKQVAVLAGGCFWGMEGVFEHVKGVTTVTAGYAGGTRGTANYDAVSSEQTNHAESVRIVYDPSIVSYRRLLDIYFAVAHDPTQVNGQYPDQGRSYRSAIFPQTDAQRQIAAAYIASLDRAHVFARPVATRIEGGNFYRAEDYHQQFMRRNPGHPYIKRWDVARVERLRTRFPELYRQS